MEPPDDGRDKRAAVIYNPISGGAGGQEASIQTQARLEAAGYTVERLPTRDRRGATPIARELSRRSGPGEVERVVAVGGDGTVRETIDGLGKAVGHIAIGIVPMGNANIVARELGIGTDVDAAIEIAVTGSPVSMDVGTVSGEGWNDTFLAVVGVGWDAHTVRMLDGLRHTELGGAAYRLWADGLYGVTGLAAALRPGSERFSLTADGADGGRDYCAAWLCNLRTYGKGMAVAPTAHRSSGRIHVQARKRAGFPFVAWQLGAALAGSPTPDFISDYLEATSIHVEGPEPFAVQVDGDDRGWTRTLEVGVRPGAAHIVAPPPD